MWYAATAVPEDDAPPIIDIDVVKTRLRVDFPDDDDLLAAMLDEATAYVEKYCNVRLGRQILTCRCDRFSDFDRLPEGPLSAGAIQSITYVDRAGTAHILDPATYDLRVNGLESSIVLKQGRPWPAVRYGELITVIMAAGYAALPPDIRDAILVRIATRYRNPENAAADAWTEVDSLLVNHRRGT